MTHKSIEEYNTYLIDNQVNVNIIEFVKEINKIKYNIDISFIDEFIELVSKDDCCIHHNMLQKYGILTLKKGTTDVKNLINQNNFEEINEYLIRNVSEQLSSGTKYKNEYYFHPRAFKICLIRSLKTKIYAKYYLLLEECIKYFNDYQTKLKENYIIKLKSKNKEQKYIIKEKDDKIDILQKSVEELIKQNNEILYQSKNTEKHNQTITNKMNDMSENLDDIKEELIDTNIKLNKTCKKLNIAVENRVPNTINPNKLECLVVLKIIDNNKYKYYAIRGQTDYVRKTVAGYLDNKLNTQLIRFKNVANSVNIWNRLKEQLKKKVKYCGNEMILLKINEEQFIENLNIVYDKRKEISIEENE
jgi:hypothetical protein